MNVLAAFEDEVLGLTKAAGVAKSVGKTVAKHPFHVLGGVAAVGSGLYAGKKGWERGKRMGQADRFLAASRHGPSRAFYTNFSRLLSRKKLRKDQIAALHEHYNEKAMKR
jgi:hypothetical protein